VGLPTSLGTTLLMLALLVLRVAAAAPPTESEMPAAVASVPATMPLAAMPTLAALIAGASSRLTAALPARVIFVHFPFLSAQPDLSSRKSLRPTPLQS
jgi:hypothetical protein